MIIAEHITVLVAKIDSEIVGYARIETAKPHLNHENYAYLGFMYTDPRHRGKGVNAVIIEALKEWCRSQNITELRFVYDNPSAIRAYEKAGFKKHLVNMRVGL
jgi:GNAT superfamily N-acetyltransferase